MKISPTVMIVAKHDRFNNGRSIILQLNVSTHLHPRILQSCLERYYLCSTWRMIIMVATMLEYKGST